MFHWTTILATIATILAGAAASAQSVPPALTAAIDQAAIDCASFEGGVLSVPDDAIIEVDLTGAGDGWVVDFADFTCSTMASFACGTGGCRVLFAVGEHVTERRTSGWTIATFGPLPVVLLDVHGSLCGGINPTPCVEAMVWDGECGQFSTLAPRDE